MADSPVSTLLPLFKKRYPDFQDFQQGDPKFTEEEDYKRGILASWEAADGVSEIKKLVAEGRGLDALKFLRKAAKFGMRYHPMGRYDILSELEKDEQKLTTLFTELDEATSDPKRYPLHCINSLLDRCQRKEIPMGWSLFFFLLWLYRPEDFFPVKITIIRAMAEKCDFEIKAGAFNEDAVRQIYEFVSTVYAELEPYKPRDLLDAQSFIWSCHSEMQNNNDLHKLWAEFLEQWPIERLREMKLEEYTNLKSNTDDYFCHWVERKTGKLGSIQGGTSAKFGIYRTAATKPKLKSGQKYADGYVWWESMGSDPESAFQTIKKNVVSLVESVMNGKPTEVVPDQPGSAVQMKIRFLYQPQPYRLLPIFSRAFLNFLSEKYMDRKCTRGEDMIHVNLELREKHFPEGDPFEVMQQLWDEYNGKKRRYWAGSTTFYGNQQMVEEFIADDEWRSDFSEESAQSTSDGKVFLESFAQVEIGDWLVMKGSGRANHIKVYYLGEVIEKDEERFALKLKPLSSPEPLPRSLNEVPTKGGARGWKGTTLAEIINPEAIQLIFGITPPAKPDSTTKPMNKELNQILYGPPGTGKTYSTVRQAVALIDGSYEDASANRRFQELKRDGRIEFLTFHQSYSYEDFVEGIRPEVDDDGSAQFTCQNGIFKDLAIKATYGCLVEISDNKGPSFSQLWERLLEKIDEGSISSLQLKNQAYIPRITAKGNIEATKQDTDDRNFGSCGRKAAQEVYTKLKSLEEVNSGHVSRAMGRGANWHVIAAVINELKKLEADWKQEDEENTADTPKEDTAEEMDTIVSAFLKDGEKSGYRLKPKEEWPPFVLIIDEINRGNISKILGELITLLEPDKRLGAENELSVQLPYSKAVFAVPGNLHLIGTMNTADKSIALVDVALRRRFQFQELNPDFDICPDLPDELQSIMEMINKRIMLRKDRDHRIGHAYFMDVDSEESFDAVMKLKVIPLLSEYFYNDWDGLRDILGERENDGGLIRPLNADSGFGRNRWQWYYDQNSAEKLSPAQVLLGNFKLTAETESAE